MAGLALQIKDNLACSGIDIKAVYTARDVGIETSRARRRVADPGLLRKRKGGQRGALMQRLVNKQQCEYAIWDGRCSPNRHGGTRSTEPRQQRLGTSEH